VVKDLEAATEFFVGLGLELEGKGEDGDPQVPANTPGIRHLAFIVDDVDAAVAGLRARGTELVGDVVSYGNSYRLCYVRGPEGIIVELAEPIS
jgi:catechol 2,3-dioxygenase-like lactoylglutathione lyase family enzyme